MYPPIAVPMYRRRNTFQILVGVEHQQYDDRRSIPFESAEKGQGDYKSPDGDNVHDQNKSGIAAAADNAGVHTHLIGHGYQNGGLDDHKGVGQFSGLRCQCVEAEQRNTDDKQNGTQGHTDADEKDLQGTDIFF